MHKRLRDLLAQKQAKIDAAKVLLEKDTEQDNAAYDAAVLEIEKLNASIKREEKLIELEREAVANFPEAARIEGGTPQVTQDPNRGFSNYGDFAQSVRRAAQGHGVDQRLINAGLQAVGGNTGVGEEGGYLIPPAQQGAIYAHSLEGDALLPLTDNMPLDGNSMSLPVDEATPWGTTGVYASWDGEGAQIAQRKPLLEKVDLKLHKLTCLVRVTDELQQDASGLSAYLTRRTGESVRYKTNDAIINGSGVGMPLGVKNASALVTQTKEASQVAATLVTGNVSKMFARLIGQQKGVWLINNEVWPQLIQMQVGNIPVWSKEAGLVGAAAGTLFGRPVILSQSCQVLGTKGDVYFLNLSSYTTITKRSGVETATSMHLWFDYAEQAYRVIFRMDGRPTIKNAVTPALGSFSLSPFVTVETRA